MTDDDFPNFDINQYIINPPTNTINLEDIKNKYLYYGNLPIERQQYKSGEFIGLALNPTHDREIKHNAYNKLLFPDNSIEGIQSEDCFEHLEYNKISFVFDEIYRVLKPKALFRLSLPDYNCPLLKQRSVYNCEGNWLCDLAVGGSVSATFNTKVQVTFTDGSDSHLWAPTYENIHEIIRYSRIQNSTTITFHHYWTKDKTVSCNTFDQSLMPVMRCPPNDMRMNGKPISLIVDFIK